VIETSNYAYKKMQLDLKSYIAFLVSLIPIEAINFLPAFASPISQFETRYFEDPNKEGKSKYRFETPQITDLEGDEI